MSFLGEKIHKMISEIEVFAKQWEQYNNVYEDEWR